MKLVKLILKNFRCYQKEIEFIIDDLTSIIGKNDIGKSSLLEALDAFFNDKIDEGDLSNEATGEAIEITCVFEGINDTQILDSSVETSLKEEGILNSDGQLQIKKEFNFGSRKTISTYIVGYHNANPELAEILSLSNTQLKELAQERGVDLKGVPKTKNPPIRAKIREHAGPQKEHIEIKVDGSLDKSSNLRNIWTTMKKWLPVYSLFKVDKTLDDKDEDVQDPMTHAIKTSLALPEIIQKLNEVEDAVRKSATEIADEIIKTLKDFDAQLVEKMRSDFRKGRSWDKVFDLTLLNEKNIPLNKRGSGIRRLVLLSFFQAQAKKKKLDNNAPGVIYGIEEPETSQHPNHQLMMIDAFKRLSHQEGVQVLFTTHNANLVREIPIKSLRYITETAPGIVIEYGRPSEDDPVNEEVVNKIVKALGILPDPSNKVKVLLYVEGNNDVNALKRYSEIMNSHDSSILNLRASDKIGYVITGGSSLKHYIEQKHLEGLGKPEVHIYDNDKKEYRDWVKKINDLKDSSKKAFNTSKLELENYLHHEAVQEAYQQNGKPGIAFPDFDDTSDIPKVVAEHVYNFDGGDWSQLNIEDQAEKVSDKKKLLNTQAVERMTVERISDRGGYDEMKSWFDLIKSFF